LNLVDLLQSQTEWQALFGCHDIKEIVFAMVGVEFPAKDVDL